MTTIGFAGASGVAGGSVNAGGGAPPGPPPLLVTSAHSPYPFFVFFKKIFWQMSGKIFLVGGPLRSGRCIYDLTCIQPTGERDTADRGTIRAAGQE